MDEKDINEMLESEHQERQAHTQAIRNAHGLYDTKEAIVNWLTDLDILQKVRQRSEIEAHRKITSLEGKMERLDGEKND